MKYIVIQIADDEDKDFIREFPIIFPNALTHAVVANSLLLSDDFKNKAARVVSAGEISCVNLLTNMYDNDPPACHGKSVSLGNLKSRGREDDELIFGHDYYHGIKYK